MRDNELSMDPLFLYQENGRVIRDFEDFNKKINDKKIVSKELKAHCKLELPISSSKLESEIEIFLSKALKTALCFFNITISI
jgi:hypothetical protein